MITVELLYWLFPELPDPTPWAEPLAMAASHYDIGTPMREAAFLAQTGHESDRFRFLRENLNYSAAALLRVFGKYFDSASAAAYARQPERIANRVYANRMGNGPEASGDGWKFRGAGLIQLTGRANVSLFGGDLGLSPDAALAYLVTNEGAAMGAGWFWSVNRLNVFADRGDMTTLTKRINGGDNGLADRLALYASAKRLLGIG